MCYVNFIFVILRITLSDKTIDLQGIYSVGLGTKIDEYHIISVTIICLVQLHRSVYSKWYIFMFFMSTEVIVKKI